MLTHSYQGIYHLLHTVNPDLDGFTKTLNKSQQLVEYHKENKIKI